MKTYRQKANEWPNISVTKGRTFWIKFLKKCGSLWKHLLMQKKFVSVDYN